jgi:GxxExxY protein
MEQIKKNATHVFKTLGAGFSERIYHNAMEVLLKRQKIPFQTEHEIPVLFESIQVGKVRADLVVDKKVVVELKAVRGVCDKHTTQCSMYMKLLNMEQGIVINFPPNDEDELDFQEISNLPICKKCGRDSHIASGCYAKTHIDGYKI